MFKQNPLAPQGVDGLAQIGRTLHDLRGIRFETGEAGAGGGTGEPNPEPKQQQEAPKPPWGDDPSKFDPDKAWSLIQNVKGDLADEKQKREQAIKDAVEAAEKNILGNIAKALGGEAPQETDPVKLNQSITDLTSKLGEKDTALTKAASDVKARDLSLAAAILAPTLGVDPKLLLTNEQFMASIVSVEPTDQAAITKAITKAVQDTPTLKATPHRSGSGEHQGSTVQSLEAQLKTAEEKGDWKSSMRLKRAIADAKRAQA